VEAPPAGGRSGSRRPGVDGADRRSSRVPPPAVRRPPPPRPPLPARPAGSHSRPGTDERRVLERSAVPHPAAVPHAAAVPRPSRTPPAAPPRAAVARRGAPPPGRLRRFVLRHGWRAYAIPLLTIATLLTLVDLAREGSAAEPAADAPSASAPASAPASASAGGTAVGSGTPAPTGPAEGESAPTATPSVASDVTYVEQGAGTVTVVPGTSPVYGTGPLRRFAVEVEDGIGIDGAGFAAAVEATLADPRSWGSDGRMSFQRVGVDAAAAGEFDFKVTLISPGNMETYCPGVGTGGYTSCRYGDRAVINLARWETAVPDYEGDVATYRLYVVNHEVGHALGNGHETCPGPGLPAPVMQQQTLGLEGCTKNPWPHP
jgi:hypothetical protein